MYMYINIYYWFFFDYLFNSEKISFQGHTAIKGAGTTTGTTLALFDNQGTPSKNVEFIDNGKVRMFNLPTSATGLSAGDIYNDSGTLKIV